MPAARRIQSATGAHRTEAGFGKAGQSCHRFHARCSQNNPVPRPLKLLIVEIGIRMARSNAAWSASRRRGGRHCRYLADFRFDEDNIHVNKIPSTKPSHARAPVIPAALRSLFSRIFLIPAGAIFPCPTCASVPTIPLHILYKKPSPSDNKSQQRAVRLRSHRVTVASERWNSSRSCAWRRGI